MSLDDLEQKDIEELVKLLLHSQQSIARISLCIKIGIDYQQLNFIEHTSDEDFCVQLVDYLKRIGNQDALCKLCCKQLLPILGKKESKLCLKRIIVKIECEQSTTILDSLPIPRKKKILRILSIFFLIVLTVIGFSNYNHPPITLQNRPAMAASNTKLYIAFTTKTDNGRKQLSVASSEDGTLPTSATPSKYIYMGGDPAMAVFKDKLYIAFKADDGSNKLYVASSDDEMFSELATPSKYIHMGGDPAMAVFKDKLYIAFRADDESNQLYVASSHNGRFSELATPSNDIHMGDELELAPAMAVFKDKLYIAFKADDGSNQLYVASSDNGKFLGPATPFKNTHMSGAPAMAVFKDKLYIAFKDDGSNQLYVASSDNGKFLGPATPFKNIRMGSNPAMAVFKDKLYIAFRANDRSNKLCLVPFPGEPR